MNTSRLIDRLRSTVYADGSRGIEHEAADEIERLDEKVDQLGAEVEALRRSRRVDANEARSREMELRAEVEALRSKCQQLATMAERAIGCSPSEMDDYLVEIHNAAIDAARKKP